MVVGHIWNVCKVSGIRAMPSHVNNQKLQPRFQRVSGHTAHVCRIYVYTANRVCTARERIPDRRSFIAPRVALADTSARVLLLDHASF